MAGERHFGAAAGRRVGMGLCALLCCATVAACTEDAAVFDRTALRQLRVTVLDSSSLGEVPYEFVSDFQPVTISVEALDYDGNRVTDFNGTLLVSVVPGEVDPTTQEVTLTDGLAASHEVQLRYAFGNARIWVEEIGLDRGQECRDGFDNDEDGLLDFPGDPGCTGPDDPSEGTASYVTGLSDPLVFKPITLHNIQYNTADPTGESPLIGSEVRVERGTLIVTNVIESGYYITDVDDTEYNGLFIFNFSFPEGVTVGDKLAWFSGGVQEFQGDTQVTFPNWDLDASYVLSDEDRQQLASCQPIDNPDAHDIVPFVLEATDFSNPALLEGQESNVVRIENAQISTRFVNCDFDFNGDIQGPGEEICRNECQGSTRCTELSSYTQFGQFKLQLGGAAPEIANTAQVAGFDPLEGCDVVVENPLEYSCPERALASATGVLRHVYLTRSIQLWVLLPRFNCDMIFACETDADCLVGGTCNSDNNRCEQDP